MDLDLDLDLDEMMDDALRGSPNAVAIACTDVRAGFVLGASARGEAAAEAATHAAACASQLCVTPQLVEGRIDEEALYEDEAQEASGALIVSSRWIHAYARVSARPELVVVGVAQGDGNVALLVDWVQRVASGLRGNDGGGSDKEMRQPGHAQARQHLQERSP